MLLTIVNGLSNNRKRKTIFHLLKNKKFDFILLQETHSNHADEKLWKYDGEGIYFILMVIIIEMVWRYYLRNLLNTKEQLHILIKQAEYCLSKLNLTTRFLLRQCLCTYKGRTNFFDAFFSTVGNFSEHDLVLGGDWNLVLDNKLDKDGGPIHSNQLSEERIKLYLNVFDLCDVIRELNPFQKSFMRYQSRPYTTTRLDLLFTSNGLRQHIQSANICESIKSNHKIALLTIKAGLEERGKG